MKETKLTRVQILLALSAVLILIALLLSVVSSGKAYSLAHLNQVIYGCAAAVVLDLIIVFFYKKLSAGLRDLMLLVAVFADAWAMCTLIEGRTLLAGYIYFSDLEASNPVAVAAMNLAVTGVVVFLVSLVLQIVVGFSRQLKD